LQDSKIFLFCQHFSPFFNKRSQYCAVNGESCAEKFQFSINGALPYLGMPLQKKVRLPQWEAQPCNKFML
jgi:hypothetical protein